MAELIIPRGPTEFDHVVLGTHDTQAGADWLAEQTGDTPFLTTPEPGQWYHSAALMLEHGAMIEMLGPNPDHQSFHPLKTLLYDFKEPSLIFWHIGTGDFDRFCKVTQAVGAPVERIEHLDNDGPHGRRTYSRGIVGPGFRSTRPCVISWQTRSRPTEVQNPKCRATRFALTDPNAEALNQVFEALGLSIRADHGPQAMEIELETPKGAIIFSGGDLRFEGLGALRQTASLWLSYVLRWR